MSETFVQIPPDSTGKRILAHDYTVSGQTVFVQGVNLVSYDNPDFGQNVDGKGAAYIRFAEGEPVLDAYSNLKTSRSVPIGVYDHSSDSQDDLYTIVEQSGGVSTFDPTNARVILSCNTGNTALVQRTINRYHFYNTGTGLLVLLSIQCGDTGKNNNVRRWGYYDDNDGFYFQLSGNTVSVVNRSSIGGIITDIAIPQSAWNIDKLDGNGLSKYELELNEVENYWISLQLPGSVRFGVFSDSGERIISHILDHSESLIASSISLPLRVENYNLTTTISTTELNEYAMSVYNDNPVDYTFWRFSDMSSSASKLVTTNTPILSIRSNLLFNGKTNRVSTYPQELAIYVSGSPIKMDIIFDTELSGSRWSLSGDSTLNGDIDATAISIGTGYKFISQICDIGVTNIDLSKFYELNDEGIMVNADGTTQPITSFVFTRLNAITTTAYATLTYRELR